jgi:hypothetical protein
MADLKPICRVGDHCTGTCTANAPNHPRTFLGTWTQGSDIVTADGIGIIRVGDTGVTDCNPPHHIRAETGSGAGSTEGAAFHRVGDQVIVIEGGTGVSSTGSPTSTSE